MAIAAKCSEATFSLAGEDEAEHIKGGRDVQVPWKTTGPVRLRLAVSPAQY